MENKRGVGSQYEMAAVCFLEQNGYEIIQQNYRCRFGEVDIIAKHQGYLVFVEVKYRKNSKCGMPVEAVDYKKQRIISKVAQQYMTRCHFYEDIPVRFDIVSVLGDKMHIYINAFDFCL